ncbi:MAG: hypothetical protein CMJ81_17300 [Planctomycetaceae bacterium]|nr:hypothetical protein [Planctomycetaceae bacterium]MBP62185.1 hypothetical protein [Planctomycetaceae bacterium]
MSFKKAVSKAGSLFAIGIFAEVNDTSGPTTKMYAENFWTGRLEFWQQGRNGSLLDIFRNGRVALAERFLGSTQLGRSVLVR